ncbi:MAG: hypothetical protein HYV63_01775 [Candidatus Schekmanbacteria bacterium]|nr:hypothetical protein [Candidatus Schekmanbacteria bacterium]
MDNTDPRHLDPCVAAEHLLAIRRLLRKDYLTHINWEPSLCELAKMAVEVLAAAECLVALYDGEASSWRAWFPDGTNGGRATIARVASLSVLEQVRRTARPLLTTASSPLELSSDSLSLNQIGSVLAVPISWWDVSDAQPVRAFAGCLYAHRRAQDVPFSDADVELILDLTELAQRNLNLMRYLGRLRQDLATRIEEVEVFRREAAVRYCLGAYESQDPWFFNAGEKRPGCAGEK